MADHPIFEACRRGDAEAVRQLIAEDPSCVNVDDQHQWRPIFHAGLNRHEAVVKLLIDAGADLAAHDGYVLHYAGEVPGNKPIVAMLVQYGALDAHVQPRDDLSRQFLAAVFLASASRVEAMSKANPELVIRADGRGDHPIHHAARNGDVGIVRILIDHGADVNARGHAANTVLYCAGGHGHAELVRVLLGAGAERDVYRRRQDLA